MDLRITGRHAELDDDVKTYVAEKLEPLARFNRHTRSMEVVLDEVNRNHVVEVIAHLEKGAPVKVHARHDDVMAAVDLAHDKLERVLRRLKEKLEDRRHARHPGSTVQATAPATDEDGDGADGVAS